MRDENERRLIKKLSPGCFAENGREDTGNGLSVESEFKKVLCLTVFKMSEI